MSGDSQTMDSANNLSDFMVALKSKTRNDEPMDVKQKCLNLCQKYLDVKSVWTQLTINDIEVVRLIGGMSNHVYYCKIVDSKVRDGNQLKEVVIRLYGTPLFQTFLILQNDLIQPIVGLLVSENGLGPKIYGMFTEGQIQKYYPHKHFTEKDLYNKDLLNQLSAKLAQFHGMTVPVNKNKMAIELVLIEMSQISDQFLADKCNLFEEYKCKNLLDYDLKKEMDWVIENIHSFNSPKVFSHNDFRFGNLMVTDDKQIVLGDFEGSSYSYRGMDFGILFCEFEELDGKRVIFRDVSIVKAFIRGYVKENEKLFGKQYSDKECNSVENILRETKVFSMIYSMFVTLVMIFNNETAQIPICDKTCLNVAECELAKYLAKKKELSSMNLI